MDGTLDCFNHSVLLTKSFLFVDRSLLRRHRFLEHTARIMDQVPRKVTISTEFLLHHRKQPFRRSGHVALGVILGPEVYNIRFVELHRLRGQYRFKRRVGQRSRS